MSLSNFSSLKDTLLASSAPRDEEKIEVNQRHLIDKILARYSAEYTIYREVLQNANDAAASQVEVIFGAVPKIDGVSSNENSQFVSSICLRNNGRPFNGEDWNRLKKIAEGNPDEQKIGFFGVGFYSLFSICEEPLVISGGSCLAFYWKGDQLYARSGPAPENYDKRWTCIYLQLREPLRRPLMDPFAHFMAKSLLFTQSLSKLTVLEGENIVFSVEKRTSTPGDLPISPGSVLKSLKSSPSSIFRLSKTSMSAVQLVLDKQYHSKEDGNISNNLLSNIWNLAKKLTKDKRTQEYENAARAPGEFSLFLHIINTELEVSTSSSFAQSMERITKKRPAKRCTMSLIYSTFDELMASSNYLEPIDDLSKSHVKHPVLDNVLPTKGNGKVFIGFETHQTTGMALHVAGPFIPTVERESLDFIDNVLSKWNQELVIIAAKIARILFEIEMISLKRLYPERNDSKLDETYWLRSNHILSSFGAINSSPSPIPSYIMGGEFTSCCENPLLVPSSVGVVSSEELRIVPASAIPFARGIPILSSAKLVDSGNFFSMVLGLLQINEASILEIMQSLDGCLLAENELVAYLDWVISIHRMGNLKLRAFNSMMSSFMVPVGAPTTSTAPLSKVTHFPAGLLKYDTAMPLPKTCLAPKICERLADYDLVEVFNLKPLTPASYVEYIFASFKDDINPTLAERVLAFLSQSFPKLSPEEQGQVASILSVFPIIPTKSGMRRPADSYLESVKMAGESSIISLQNKSAVSDSFLIAIGVQTHIDVSMIFQNLDKLAWNHRQVIKYLASVRNELTEKEISILKSARLFPALQAEDKRKGFTLCELYLESDVAKQLNLPVLEWQEGYGPNPRSESTKFMLEMGLNAHPPLDLLLAKAAVKELHVRSREALLRYFISNYETHYKDVYNPHRVTYSFLPSRDTDCGSHLYGPKEIFYEEALQSLGFPVLVQELVPFATYFGVARLPPSASITKRIIAKDWNPSLAPQLFAFMSRILSELTSTDLQQLGSVEILPANLSETLKWHKPKDVFFTKGRYELKDFFIAVDFGVLSRPFLQACGVQEEPNPAQLARKVALEPQTLLANLGSESYLDLLRFIALQVSFIKKQDPNSLELMSCNPCLIGVGYDYENENEDSKEEGSQRSVKFILSRPLDLYVIDDAVAQQYFNCLSVPSDSILESFYCRLGSQYLSKCIKKTCSASGPLIRTHLSDQLTDRIKSRAKLIVGEGSSSTSQGENTLKSQAFNILKSVHVFQVNSILISRKFRDQEHKQPTTACLDTNGRLVITQNYDYFHVGTVICDLIYEKGGRLPDALLLATLISDSLQSLRSKGFQVDRILGHDEGACPKVVENIPPTELPPAMDPISQAGPQTQTIANDQTNLVEHGAKDHSRKLPSDNSMVEDLGRSVAGLLGSLKQKIKTRGASLGFAGSTGTRPPPSVTQDDETRGTIMTTNEIKSSLQKSIRNLRSHDKSDFDDPSRISQPPSTMTTQSESYCEIIPGTALAFAGSINDIQLYIAKSISDPRGFLQKYNPILINFGQVIMTVASVFSIPQASLHIFYDRSARAIAFNRAGTLFFNAAYYERQLLSDETGKNQIFASWYMTFCHELAHNFIGPHDERHEYYMSSFAEAYLEDLLRLLLQ